MTVQATEQNTTQSLAVDSQHDLQYMLFNNQAMEQMHKLAEVMASGNVTVPDHLKKNTADCLAIVMQSAQWQMNPFSVCQKTHLVGGKLGYEAQLVNAVIVSQGPMIGRPEYEFYGDWNKILGKVNEKSGKSGGTYYTAGWNTADESGLGVICSVSLKNQENPVSVDIKLAQCWPRFSTQWATDPQQQICYVAIKKLARRYFPDVVLGVYTADELEPAGEREINPIPKAEARSNGRTRSIIDYNESDDQPEEPTASDKGQPQRANPFEGESDDPYAGFDDDEPPVPQDAPALRPMLESLEMCDTQKDLQEWRELAERWPENHPVRQQLVQAYGAHVQKLKAQHNNQEQ